jgi:hypothetical protein
MDCAESPLSKQLQDAVSRSVSQQNRLSALTKSTNRSKSPASLSYYSQRSRDVAEDSIISSARCDRTQNYTPIPDACISPLGRRHKTQPRGTRHFSQRPKHLASLQPRHGPLNYSVAAGQLDGGIEQSSSTCPASPKLPDPPPRGVGQNPGSIPIAKGKKRYLCCFSGDLGPSTSCKEIPSPRSDEHFASLPQTRYHDLEVSYRTSRRSRPQSKVCVGVGLQDEESPLQTAATPEAVRASAPSRTSKNKTSCRCPHNIKDLRLQKTLERHHGQTNTNPYHAHVRLKEVGHVGGSFDSNSQARDETIEMLDIPSPLVDEKSKRSHTGLRPDTQNTKPRSVDDTTSSNSSSYSDNEDSRGSSEIPMRTMEPVPGQNTVFEPDRRWCTTRAKPSCASHSKHGQNQAHDDAASLGEMMRGLSSCCSPRRHREEICRLDKDLSSLKGRMKEWASCQRDRQTAQYESLGFAEEAAFNDLMWELSSCCAHHCRNRGCGEDAGTTPRKPWAHDAASGVRNLPPGTGDGRCPEDDGTWHDGPSTKEMTKRSCCVQSLQGFTQSHKAPEDALRDVVARIEELRDKIEALTNSTRQQDQAVQEGALGAVKNNSNEVTDASRKSTEGKDAEEGLPCMTVDENDSIDVAHPQSPWQDSKPRIPAQPHPQRSCPVRAKTPSRASLPETSSTDRQILHGLHVLLAAVADESIDAIVARQTGLELRQFVADLATAFVSEEKEGGHAKIGDRKGK